MKKLSIKQKNFHAKISQILWEDWDPIGVNDGNNTWADEYDSYVPDIFQKVVDGRDAHKIANILSSCAKQSMGVASDQGRDLNVASLIIKAKQSILG